MNTTHHHNNRSSNHFGAVQGRHHHHHQQLPLHSSYQQHRQQGQGAAREHPRSFADAEFAGTQHERSFSQNQYYGNNQQQQHPYNSTTGAGYSSGRNSMTAQKYRPPTSIKKKTRRRTTSKRTDNGEVQPENNHDGNALPPMEHTLKCMTALLDEGLNRIAFACYDEEKNEILIEESPFGSPDSSCGGRD